MTTDNLTIPQRAEILQRDWRIEPTEAFQVATGHRKLEQVKTEWNTNELLSYDFPPQKFIVPDLISEGLTTLAGRPKVGKSWLILQVLKGLSIGGDFLGYKLEPKRCLYLALEDSPRRVSERMKAQGWQANSNIDVEFRLPKPLNLGGIDWLREKIEDSEYQFAVIDTINRSLSNKVKRNDSGDVSKAYGEIQAIAFDYDCPITLLDHFNKSNGREDSDDIIDGLSDSTAKAAVCDTIFGIIRKSHEATAKLKVTGRDVGSLTKTIEFNPDTCLWQLSNKTSQENTPLGQCLKVIQELNGNSTFKNIHESLGWPKATLSDRLKKWLDSGDITLNDKVYIKPMSLDDLLTL